MKILPPPLLTNRIPSSSHVIDNCQSELRQAKRATRDRREEKRETNKGTNYAYRVEGKKRKEMKTNEPRIGKKRERKERKRTEKDAICYSRFVLYEKRSASLRTKNKQWIFRSLDPIGLEAQKNLNRN